MDAGRLPVPDWHADVRTGLAHQRDGGGGFRHQEGSEHRLGPDQWRGFGGRGCGRHAAGAGPETVGMAGRVHGPGGRRAAGGPVVVAKVECVANRSGGGQAKVKFVAIAYPKPLSPQNRALRKGHRRLDFHHSVSMQTAIEPLIARCRPGWSLPGEFYSEEAVYRHDLARVWRTGWLFAGHACEIPRVGDYFTLEVDTDSIIVARGEDGAVYGLHNVC